MDPLTQGLLGAATAQLGFRQRIGRDASWMAFLTAMAPDLDFLAPRVMRGLGFETDELTRMFLHRGISHSLLAVPFIALPVAAAWWWIRNGVLAFRNARRPPPDPQAAPGDKRSAPAGFAMIYACLFVAVLSHAPLDLCTSYGTQIFAPFTTKRYAVDAIGIIDIIYTPILAATLVACYVVRKLKADPRRATLAIGWTGFLLSVAYIAAGRVMHDRAIDKALAMHGRPACVRANAYPAIGTILLWRVVIETDEAWHLARIHHLAPHRPGRDPPDLQTVPKHRDNPWVRRTLQLPLAKQWDWFAMGNTRAGYERRGNLHVVSLYDMRYTWPLANTRSLWWLEVTYDRQGRMLAAGRRTSHHRRNFGKLIRRIWDDIWSP